MKVILHYVYQCLLISLQLLTVEPFNEYLKLGSGFKTLADVGFHTCWLTFRCSEIELRTRENETPTRSGKLFSR